MGGQAVFQTVQAAGVLRDVAAYGAGKLAGRVGGVEKAVWRGGIGNGLVAHAGLDRGGARLRVDFQNAVKPRHRQQKPVGRGRAAAGQTRARTAHGNGYPQPRTGFQNGLHLRFGFRQGDGQRRAGENGQRVAFVGFQLVFRRQQGHAVQHAAQVFLQHGALFGIKGGLRGGFLHGGLRSGKTSGQYSLLADACKTASGLCRPAFIFSDDPNMKITQCKLKRKLKKRTTPILCTGRDLCKIPLSLFSPNSQNPNTGFRLFPSHRLQMALRTYFEQTKIGCPGVAEFTVQRPEALFDHITGFR